MSQIKLLSPYLTEGYTWLKGNLHTHTTFSDGTHTAEEVIANYEQCGYDFLGISDHDVFTAPHDYQHMTQMVLIPVVEVTSLGPHIQQIGVHQRVEPDTDRQAVVDRINSDGGFAVMNHPNWEWHFNHFPQEMMSDLQGAIGLEVYNGVIERLDGSALASDRWDRLLSVGRQLWGFANDDAHYPTDVGVAWNVVQSPARSADDIMSALRQGQFYASTGVMVKSVEIDGLCIRIETENAQRIRFLTRFGTIRSSTDGASAEWELPDNLTQLKNWRYVRIECYGEGGRMAWLQPIRIDVH